MKSKIYSFLVILFLLISCSSVSNISSHSLDFSNLIYTKNFTFHAEYVIPSSSGFTPKYLTSEYDLKVTPDTVSAHLPYYGIAYSAPYNFSENGINFISDKFTYSVLNHTDKSWSIKIIINDKFSPVSLILEIWNNGKTYLTVNDYNKQVINYQGYISNN